MSLPILTPQLWESFTPEEKIAYRTQIFSTRPSDKLICKLCKFTIEDGCVVEWEKPATSKGKGKWVPVAGGDVCSHPGGIHEVVGTPWLIGKVEVYLDTPEMAEYQKLVFAYYRVTGFPHYRLEDVEKEDSFRKLLEANHESVYREVEINGKLTPCLTQTMHGLGLAWTYFEHMWKVVCNDMKTPHQVFEDDALLMKAIVKRMKWGTYISDSGMRKALRSYSGTQSVSNFRPTAAAAVYHHYLPEAGGVTWDMSSGFGGRILGAMACGRVRKYIGTDPSTPTMDGLRKMWGELEPLLYKLKPNRPELIVELHKEGSEGGGVDDKFVIEPESIDLCFTSPPYFDTEKYTDEETQSYKKFETKEKWLDGFMRQTLERCHLGLKSDGWLVVNIAAVKSYDDLHDDFVGMAESVGFKLVPEDCGYLLLSRMMGTRKKAGVVKEGAFKTEPLFVFKKV
jgi:hypothetical protein